MNRPNRSLAESLLTLFLLCSWSAAQQTSAVVPRLVSFSGKATDAQGKAISGIAGATFAIYKEQYEGTPRWLETQNIQADATGNYSVQLGATKANGLPMELFSTGEARWLGVTINGEGEQPRVLLLSVPYALKAADAETVGGLPPSAFVLAAAPNSAASPSAAGSVSSSTSLSPLTLAGSGTLDFVPLWTPDGNTLGNSVVFQSGSGSTAKVGINTTTPASTLDVKGSETVRGNLSLPATGTSTATSGKNSQPTTLTASVFNRTTGTAVPQNFRWQAEPAANNTSSPSGTMNLLFGSGSNPINETGLKIASNGQISFANGQVFPGTGSVTSVGLSASASDFTVTGSPVTSIGNLTLNWTVAPASLNTPNAIVKRDASGNMAAGVISATVVNATNSTVNGTLTVGAGANISNAGGPAVVASTSGANAAITGTSTGTNAVSDGVDGISSSATASGVAGINNAGGVGLYGADTANIGTGVFGVSGNVSSTGAGFVVLGVGVHGDGGASVGGIGVAGTVDDGNAGYFINNSSLGAIPVVIYARNSASGILLQATNLATSGGCFIESTGTISCTGSKSAVVPVDGGARKIALYAIEGPENWFEDLGGAQLVNGAAVVHVESTFAQTVNTAVDYRVFLTPNGECKGLYVTNKTANSFEVRELGGGTSDISFDYRIIAKRKGYEDIRLADKTKLFEAPKLSRRHASDKTTLVRPKAAPRLGTAYAPQNRAGR
jgi:hypothetical protein